jgi:hypothetical protein
LQINDWRVAPEGSGFDPKLGIGPSSLDLIGYQFV